MLNRFRPRKEVPIAARRRAWLITVAHLGHRMDHPQIQEILGKWIAKGDLPQADWDIIEALAKAGMNKYRD